MIFTAAAFALLQASAFALPANIKAPQNDLYAEGLDTDDGSPRPDKYEPESFGYDGLTTSTSAHATATATGYGVDPLHELMDDGINAATFDNNYYGAAGTHWCTAPLPYEGFEGARGIVPCSTTRATSTHATSTHATATSTGTASATDSSSSKVVLIAIPADEEKKVTELLKKNGLSMTGKYNSDDDTDGVQNKSFLSGLLDVGTSILSFVPLLL